MAGGTFRSGAAFAKAFKADLKRLAQRVDTAMDRAVQRAAEQVRENAPKASGFLAESIRAEGLRIVCDAPYALAVERGSRPHWPPIAPLIAWVQLKGFMGVGKANSAESIAWAIAHKISVEGTKPTWFMRNAIPVTMGYLGLEIKLALLGN